MNDLKEVYFDTYCAKCKHKDIPEAEEPCNECLTQPFMVDSHKPLHFKEAK